MLPLEDGIVYDSGMVPLCEPYYVYCGNLVTESGESCDDGNTIDGDGCSSGCLNEAIPVDVRCGNAVCDASDAKCNLSNSDCSNIDPTVCN